MALFSVSQEGFFLVTLQQELARTVACLFSFRQGRGTRFDERFPLFARVLYSHFLSFLSSYGGFFVISYYANAISTRSQQSPKSLSFLP